MNKTCYLIGQLFFGNVLTKFTYGSEFNGPLDLRDERGDVEAIDVEVAGRFGLRGWVRLKREVALHASRGADLVFRRRRRHRLDKNSDSLSSTS
jgi:hypothetical protein